MAGDYRVPDRSKSEADRLGWLTSSRGLAESWLQTQPNYRQFRDAIALLSSFETDDIVPEGMSTIRAGEVRRDIRELVATLSNLREISNFKTENKDLYNNAATLDKLYSAWWYMTKPSKSIKGSLQMAAGLGTGYLGATWDPDFHGPGRGNVRLSVFGPHEVLPVQLPRDGDIQGAYAVHIKTEMPLATAHKEFWKFRDKIAADRQSPSWMKKGMEKVTKFLSPALQAFGVGREGPSTDPVFPTVDVFHTYVDDPSINQTGASVVMGEPGTLWEYKVPSMGTMIDSGIRDKNTGQPLMREVTIEEARLYPTRRLIIWCETCVMYDNVSQWWHGKVPVVPVDLDRWTWEQVGRPLTADVTSIETSMTRLMRAIDDSANTRLSPPLAANTQLVSEDQAEDFNPRIPNQTIAVSSLGGKAFEPILSHEFYNVPTFIPEWVKYLEGRTRRILGVSDAEALMKARQIPAQDSIEKIREMAGSIVVDMTNSLEDSIQGVGELWMWLTFQFMTVKRRVQVLGDDGITPEDFDYDPGTLVPSHMPGEQMTDAAGQPVGSTTNLLERARWYAGQFYFFVVPGSLHRMTQTTRRLQLLMLKKAGVPIDAWTIAEAFEIPNYGPEPKGTKNVMERVQAERRMNEEAAARMAEATGKAGGQQGRPNSNNKPPHVELKDGGTRPTVATS